MINCVQFIMKIKENCKLKPSLISAFFKLFIRVDFQLIKHVKAHRCTCPALDYHA